MAQLTNIGGRSGEIRQPAGPVQVAEGPHLPVPRPRRCWIARPGPAGTTGPTGTGDPAASARPGVPETGAVSTDLSALVLPTQPIVEDPTALFRNLVAFGGYLLGAGVMIACGVIAAFLGVNAEGKSLEDVASPLAARRAAEESGRDVALDGALSGQAGSTGTETPGRL